MAHGYVRRRLSAALADCVFSHADSYYRTLRGGYYNSLDAFAQDILDDPLADESAVIPLYAAKIEHSIAIHVDPSYGCTIADRVTPAVDWFYEPGGFLGSEPIAYLGESDELLGRHVLREIGPGTHRFFGATTGFEPIIVCRLVSIHGRRKLVPTCNPDSIGRAAQKYRGSVSETFGVDVSRSIDLLRDRLAFAMV